ncbi:MAG: UDP-N-acetylmuramate dehydrogenase [Taibaiella sp.]|nr:UDP-N-acetylmuramate dehydrogenase [Taibaiella sp.]
MQVQDNISLRPYNTFGIDAQAEYFMQLTDTNQLAEIATSWHGEKHVIGGGSNILLTKDVEGITILNCLKGIEQVKEDENHVWLKVASGEVWHELVMYAIDHEWAGIENLALIPGTVGAAPMQNIGAYGVEVKEAIEEVTCWHWEEQRYITLNNAQCRFGYRDSIFKHELKGKVFITYVVFRLNKRATFNTSYGAISQQLEKMGVTELSIKAIADAVIAIRSSKLPDPKLMGNAGSFFKNPSVSKLQYDKLQLQYPGIPSYPIDDTHVKVPAGWLIEQCGLKGYLAGNTAVHDKQALVLVNKGQAKGKEVWELSEKVLQTVQQKFGITLEREVQVW